MGGKARRMNWCCSHRTWDDYFVGNIGPMKFLEDCFHLDSSSILEPGIHRRERTQLCSQMLYH